MSHQAVEAVINHSRTRGADRLVMLALAYRADRDTAECWPSTPTIAADSTVSERQVPRSVRAAVELGELEVRRGAGGDSDTDPRYRSTRYRITLPGVTRSHLSGVTTGQPSGVTARPPRGDTSSDSGVTPRHPNSHREQSVNNSSSVGGDYKSEPAASSDDDDDGLSSDLVEAVVTLKVAGVAMLNPSRYRATVAASVPAEHGDDLRRVLAEHPAWPSNWIAAHVLGQPRINPTPAEVIRDCPDCTNGLVDTGAGMDRCPTCAWARAS